MSHAPAQNGFTLYHLGQDGQCTLKDSERGPDPTNPDRVPARLGRVIPRTPTGPRPSAGPTWSSNSPAPDPTPTECRPDLVE